jgi:Glycosyl transferase family 2/Glycosyl transferases group 1
VPGFARALAAIRPDIGLAPVVGDDFDRAHSELHWLEYTMVGAATVASRTMGGGPYDVIRDGADGLLARNKAEWRDGLRRLAGSPALRAEIAGRARERVLAEYHADKRAEEWAEAYRWAAENGGRGALPRLRAVGSQPNQTAAGTAARVAAESRDNFIHRRRVRAEAAEAAALLATTRGDGDVCWPAGADEEPLVSVIIPTYNRGRLVVERAISSVLAQTYQNFEIVVIGDCATPETVEAVLSVKDPRIVFENLPVRSPRPDDLERAWMMSGSRPYNRGLELARGSWIAPLSDDDEFTPDHLAILLAAAIDNRLEFVYGQSWMENPDGTWFRLGEWPPRLGGFGACSLIYSAGIAPMRLDDECWREDEPNDWNLWRRMREAGVRMGYIPRIVFRHYAEARHRTKAS